MNASRDGRVVRFNGVKFNKIVFCLTYNFVLGLVTVLQYHMNAIMTNMTNTSIYCMLVP